MKLDNTISGSLSHISEDATVEINVDTLDNLVNKKVIFIKMAISVYYKADNFWKIPEQVLNIRDDYDLYMRQYTEGTDETVMFFMPREA